VQTRNRERKGVSGLVCANLFRTTDSGYPGAKSRSRLPDCGGPDIDRWQFPIRLSSHPHSAALAIVGERVRGEQVQNLHHRRLLALDAPVDWVSKNAERDGL